MNGPAVTCRPCAAPRHTAILRPKVGGLLAIALTLLLAACAAPRRERHPVVRPQAVRARIVRMLPSSVDDRQGWATDIYAAFAAQQLDPSDGNLCAAVAVAGQESLWRADPPVPGLGRIARAEIDRRAAAHHIPAFVVTAALALHATDGRSYASRIAGAHTEGELSRIYEDLIGRVPLGQRLFGDDNPVHTGGPMQVSVAFAEAYARDHPYPYPVAHSIRREVFTRRGGLYFGIAHLLGYPADYDRPLYRFADYNAGWYASRNAAFQKAVTLASGIPLALDGDLVRYGSGLRRPPTSATERAVQTLAARLDLDPDDIHDALEQGETEDFARSEVHRAVFALAERTVGHALPRAVVPRIRLDSPKITRKLTTAWFAGRVDRRYRQCLARVGKD